MSIIEQGRRQEGKHDLTTEQMQNMLFFENKQVTNDFSHTMDDFLKANRKGGAARKDALAAKLKARDDARVMATVKRLEVSLEVSAARLPPRNAGRGPQDVNLANVSLASPTGTSLLEGANLTFAHGRKYGLIGRNGVGKSTLLREISSYELDGFPQHLRVLHVEQGTCYRLRACGEEQTIGCVVATAGGGCRGPYLCVYNE
jgi:ATP-binding cassette subfamily F protein 3